jgi:hypothetical protein
MIVRNLEGEIWLFDQRDHSAVCGSMARFWGADPFQPVPETVCRAADTHDSGWLEWDRAPRLDPKSGQPHRYSAMPAADYRVIWGRGLQRGWEQGDLVGLLVSLHAMRFFSRKDHPADRELLARERDRQQDVLARLGYSTSTPDALPEPIATWHDWIFCWDALSLFLCEGWESPWSRRIASRPNGERVELSARRRERGEPGVGELRITPNAWLRSFRLEIAARVIPERFYASQAELDDALGSSRRERVSWTVIGDQVY